MEREGGNGEEGAGEEEENEEEGDEDVREERRMRGWWEGRESKR